MAKGRKYAGRKCGTPNKATREAREAIAAFVDGNAHRLQGWLDDIANGVQDDDGKYVVKPDPQTAFELFQSVIEYHVPKLARTELSDPSGKPLNFTLVIPPKNGRMDPDPKAN